jgi:hypothetical protein
MLLHSACENKKYGGKKTADTATQTNSQSVSEVDWYCAIMGSATTKYSKDLHYSQYLSLAAQPLHMPQKIK